MGEGQTIPLRQPGFLKGQGQEVMRRDSVREAMRIGQDSKGYQKDRIRDVVGMSSPNADCTTLAGAMSS